MASDYKVPFALDGENVIDVASAKKKVDYKCMECGGVVRRRGGAIISDHFYHFNESACTGEGVIHLTAKRIIGSMPSIRYMTPRIKSEYKRSDKWSWHGGKGKFSELYFSAHTEYIENELSFKSIVIEGVDGSTVIPGSNYRADLMFVSQSGQVGYIEIVHKHRTDPAKLNYYIDNGILVIDVNINKDTRTLDELLVSLSNASNNCLVSCNTSVLARKIDNVITEYAKKIHKLRNEKEALEKEIKEIKTNKSYIVEDLVMDYHNYECDKKRDLDNDYSGESEDLINKYFKLEKKNLELWELLDMAQNDAKVANMMLDEYMSMNGLTHQVSDQFIKVEEALTEKGYR